MFNLLKEKLKSFFGKEEKSKEKEKKKSKKEKSPKKEKQVKKKTKNKDYTETEKIEAEVAYEEIEAEIKEEKQEKKGFLSNILNKFTTSKIEKEQVEEIFNELEIILLENNVALEVVDKIKENLINSLVGQEVKPK